MAHYSNKSALARIKALQAALNASDGIAEGYAAQHLADGTPAYGWTCKYHNQRASLFASTVARLGNVEAAIEELTPYFTMHGATFDPQPLLQYLLPLNAAAVRDLTFPIRSRHWPMSEVILSAFIGCCCVISSSSAISLSMRGQSACGTIPLSIIARYRCSVWRERMMRSSASLGVMGAVYRSGAPDEYPMAAHGPL